MISFSPLYEYLKKHEISKYQLIKAGIVTSTEFTIISINHNFSLKFIDRLCKELNCEVSDIIKYIDDSNL